jgi:hypothetical protein
VAQGAVGPLTTDPESVGFDIDATDPLHPWRQYRFAVEVQAGPPAGAPTVGVLLPGEWSTASAPVALTVIPPLPPADPSALAIANAGATLTITLTHPAPDTLFATAVGPYRFETWRVEPGKRPIPLTLAYSRGAGATWTATDASAAAPSGTYVTVRVIDPIGRASDAVVSNKVP